MSKKHIGSSLGSFLDEMKIREQTELLAIKKTLSIQVRQAMKRRSVSQSRLAKQMRTSRTVINRMLDPSDTGARRGADVAGGDQAIARVAGSGSGLLE